MISEAILIPDCKKSHLILQNFLEEAPDTPPALAPSALGSGLRPLTGSPFSKIPGSAPDSITITPSRDWINTWVAGNTVRYLTTRAILQRFFDEVASQRVAMSRVRILPCHFLR